MMKVLLQGLGLLIMLCEFCIGEQTETLRIARFINPDSAVPKLEYRVTLVQDSFLLYDPVGIRLSVKNLSSDTARVWINEMEGWVLRGRNGKQYSSTVSILYGGPRVIPPGDSLGTLTNLNDYGVKIPGLYPDPALPVSEYAVYYKIDSDSTRPVTFRVIEPEGEERNALELYLETFSPITGDEFFRSTTEQRIEFYREYVRKLLQFVDRFPKNVYAVNAISRALSAARGVCRDIELAKRINDRIMREYPDSHLNGFDFLKSCYKDNPTVLRTVLDSIIRTNPHPRITAGAKATLRELGLEKQ